jgi:hypothetical protein
MGEGMGSRMTRIRRIFADFFGFLFGIMNVRVSDEWKGDVDDAVFFSWLRKKLRFEGWFWVEN